MRTNTKPVKGIPPLSHLTTAGSWLMMEFQAFLTSLSRHLHPLQPHHRALSLQPLSRLSSLLSHGSELACVFLCLKAAPLIWHQVQSSILRAQCLISHHPLHLSFCDPQHAWRTCLADGFGHSSSKESTSQMIWFLRVLDHRFWFPRFMTSRWHIKHLTLRSDCMYLGCGVVTVRMLRSCDGV